MSASARLGSSVILALFITYAVWGTVYYAMRVALHAYPPFFLGSVRFLLAGTLLATSYAYVNPAIAFTVGCIFDNDTLHVSTSLSLLGVLAGVWLIVRHEAKP